MPKTNLLEPPALNSEPRFPDLSLPHDLSDPIICLIGIENYCNVLLATYEQDARRWWRAEDAAANSYELARKGNEFLEVIGDHLKELQQHAQIYREACETWQDKLRELADAASRAMPETLLSCKVIKLHPDQLYCRDNNTDWPAFSSDLKRMQVEAHRLVVSKQEPKALAEAIRSFLHEIGCMCSEQHRLAQKLELFQQLLRLGEQNRETRKSVHELLADVEAARKKVQLHRDKVLALAILPPHQIDGVSPEEWRFRLLRDVKELTDLVAGQHSNAKTELSVAEKKQVAELYQTLERRGREADNFIGIPIEDVGQEPNHDHAPAGIWKSLLWPFGEVANKGKEYFAIGFWLTVVLVVCWSLNHFLHWGIDLNRFRFWKQ